MALGVNEDVAVCHVDPWRTVVAVNRWYDDEDAVCVTTTSNGGHSGAENVRNSVRGDSVVIEVVIGCVTTVIRSLGVAVGGEVLVEGLWTDFEAPKSRDLVAAFRDLDTVIHGVELYCMRCDVYGIV